MESELWYILHVGKGRVLVYKATPASPGWLKKSESLIVEGDDIGSSMSFVTISGAYIDEVHYTDSVEISRKSGSIKYANTNINSE